MTLRGPGARPLPRSAGRLDLRLVSLLAVMWAASAAVGTSAGVAAAAEAGEPRAGNADEAARSAQPTTAGGAKARGRGRSGKTGGGKTAKGKAKAKAAAAASTPSADETGGGGSGPEFGPAALGKLRILLSGTDDDVFLETVKTLGAAHAANASIPLVEVLAMGTTPPLAVATLKALRQLAQPRTADILLAYSGHRNVDVRKSAVEALAALPDPRVPAVLLAKLGDEDEQVRAVAIPAAVARAKNEAAPRLLALFKMREAAAAVPLGQVVPVGELPGLLELRGQVRDADLATVLAEVLKRKDVPDPSRVEIVHTLAEIPGPDATTALAEYVADSSGGSTRPSRVLAKKALDERGKTP